MLLLVSLFCVSRSLSHVGSFDVRVRVTNTSIHNYKN